MNSLGLLRSILPDELELMRSWRNAPQVRANMYTRHEISQAEHILWWERTKKRDDQIYFMYEHDGNPSGILSFTALDKINKNCSWAFYAAPDAPRGTGSRMEFLALEQVFNVLLLHKLHCEVLAFNTPVIKLHQKFGFQVEGIFREHHFHEGSYIDVFHLGLLASDWIAMRDDMFAKLVRTSKG